MQTRTAIQEWHESDADNNFEWVGEGWQWEDTGEDVNEDWELVNVTDRDKHFNPIKATFKQKEEAAQLNTGLASNETININYKPEYKSPLLGFDCGICGQVQTIHEGNSDFHSLRMCDNCKSALKEMIKCKVAEPQTEEKPTYQITAFRSKKTPDKIYKWDKHSEVYVLPNDYRVNALWEYARRADYFDKNNEYEIYGIKNRVGVEITVGKYYKVDVQPKPYKVGSIFIEGDNAYFKFEGALLGTPVNANVEEAEPLLVTEDGVPILDEESVVWVVYTAEDSVWQVTHYVAKFCMRPKSDLKVFSTKEKVEAYVRQNKPVLTLDDVHRTFFTKTLSSNEQIVLNVLFGELKEIVASRLKPQP